MPKFANSPRPANAPATDAAIQLRKSADLLSSRIDQFVLWLNALPAKVPTEFKVDHPFEQGSMILLNLCRWNNGEWNVTYAVTHSSLFGDSDIKWTGIQNLPLDEKCAFMTVLPEFVAAIDGNVAQRAKRITDAIAVFDELALKIGIPLDKEGN